MKNKYYKKLLAGFNHAWGIFKNDVLFITYNILEDQISFHEEYPVITYDDLLTIRKIIISIKKGE